jgi:calpain-7
VTVDAAGNSSATQEQKYWQNLLSASSYGDCLVTISTGNFPEAHEEKLGLVSTHAYAVLTVREEEGGVRLLQVKSPL